MFLHLALHWKRKSSLSLQSCNSGVGMVGFQRWHTRRHAHTPFFWSKQFFWGKKKLLIFTALLVILEIGHQFSFSAESTFSHSLQQTKKDTWPSQLKSTGLRGGGGTLQPCKVVREFEKKTSTKQKAWHRKLFFRKTCESLKKTTWMWGWI